MPFDRLIAAVLLPRPRAAARTRWPRTGRSPSIRVTRTRECIVAGAADFWLQMHKQPPPRTLRALRLLLVTLAVAAVSLGGAARALACGSGGYSYAGLGAQGRAFGISAVVTPLSAFNVLNGHVAGWVGVGGPGEGPAGTDEWLQIGLSGFPGMTGSDVYYEVALPNHYPVYHQVMTDVPVGKPVKVSVLEMHNRPNWWRVWLNHRPASQPIRLPQSHARWSPIATAESWDGGTGGTCNTFLYRFRRVQVAQATGGGWHPLTGGYPISSSETRVQRARGTSAFVAAEGQPAFQFLSITP